MSKILILIICAGLCAAAPQFLIQSPMEPYQHPAVLINSAMEANLPNELKNDFYKNPHIAAGLAQESWFSRKESQVCFFNQNLFQIKPIMFHNINV